MTQHGTCVAAPEAVASAAEASKATDVPPKAGSYAAAVKTAPTDWHFSFTIDGQELSNTETVYGAIHRTQATSSARVPLWNITPTMHFKKVNGAAPTPVCESTVQNAEDAGSGESLPLSLGIDSAPATILRMMRALHSVNIAHGDTMGSDRSRCLTENAFVNNKLTAKFIRQLDELIIVARCVELANFDGAVLTKGVWGTAIACQNGLTVYLIISRSSFPSTPAIPFCSLPALATRG